MEMKLTVLAGAKEGTSIPLKKDEFVIGRASECTLRAGSDAISRKHCAITRADDGYMVRDLGSRNGTILNGELLSSAKSLQVGDELRVGPLTFRVDPAETNKPASPQQSAPATSPEAQSAGLKKTRQPPVKDVADVAARVADHGGQDELEDDISRWLIGTDSAQPANNETVNFHIDETKAMRLDEVNRLDKQQAPEESAEPADEEDAAESSDEAENVVTDEDELPPDEAEENPSESGWSLFGRGKSKKDAAPKSKPGKLPKVPEKDKAKDSREAAANVLREMTRRR